MIWSANRLHFAGSCAWHEGSIFNGFPLNALTFLNRLRPSPDWFRLDANVGIGS
jgi:hypothetical protein